MKVISLNERPRIVIVGFAEKLSLGDEASVSEIWEQACEERGTGLFNGPIASVRKYSTDLIEVEISDYRRLLASREHKGLQQKLTVKPLAVSGLIRSPDGIVFGRRGKGNYDSVGFWELVPSGGIDPKGYVIDDEVEYSNQILAELREEIGLSAERVKQMKLLCLIDDDSTNVIDLGIELIIEDASASEIRNKHKNLGSDEYTQIQFVPEGLLTKFVESNHQQILPVSLAILENRGLISRGGSQSKSN